MLDLFRRQRRYLKPIFWLVILALAAGMVLFFVPFWGDTASTYADAVATVAGEPITATEFNRAYANIFEFYSRAYNLGDNRSLLKALQIDQIALNRLIENRVVELEAKRFGLFATDLEVAEMIQKYPGFQQDGKFIGKEAYLRALKFSNVSPRDFEEEMRVNILRDKLQKLLTDGIIVTEEEIKKEYLRQNEKAEITYVAFNINDFTNQVSATDKELQEYFNKNRDKFKIPQRRRGKYVVVDQSQFEQSITVTEREMREYFENNPGEETAKIAHILFKVEENASPEEENRVRKRAESVLAELKKGANFAELAKKYSEDTASAANGGEMPYSPPSTFVPEFAQAAFALQPGQISDPVRTRYGFHIIKLIDKKKPTFEEKRASIETILRAQKLDEAARQRADSLEAALRRTKDIAKAAAEFKLQVKETPLLKSGDQFDQVQEGYQIAQTLFTLQNVGDFSSPVKLLGGYALVQLVEMQQPRDAQLAEVKADVEREYKKSKASEMAASKAREFLDAVKSQGDFQKAAEKLKLKTAKSAEFTRQGPIDAMLGNPSEVIEKIFNMQAGQVSDVMAAGDYQVVFRVDSRRGFDPEKFAKEKERIRDQLLAEKRSLFFQAYISATIERLQKDKKISINQNLIKRITS